MRQGILWLLLVLPRVLASRRFLLPPAEVRRYQEVRTPLSLEHPYYPARGERGIELLPKDRYFEEVESLLESL